jgi:hypothetical protein
MVSTLAAMMCPHFQFIFFGLADFLKYEWCEISFDLEFNLSSGNKSLVFELFSFFITLGK